ncbi:MAG: hypothetical protein JEZ07_19420 [Phycisphaerae bacterium]|nr:hypothetical protein [Phycisphaerae bacterium]
MSSLAAPGARNLNRLIYDRGGPAQQVTATPFIYYHFQIAGTSRTHMSLGKDAPEHREVQAEGKIVSKPILGGLHHIYSRVA